MVIKRVWIIVVTTSAAILIAAVMAPNLLYAAETQTKNILISANAVGDFNLAIQAQGGTPWSSVDFVVESLKNDPHL